ncbi:SIS domain-containing protein [Fusobacterium perfoetens]|uniref:KpsF/GutQ family sugar-phosphate isomerase n=1 Tax=Fusobacterium perfoetens TaxID=852 RepID=UPI0026E94FCA|nr:KpsF/GutQ family sugar-phosphate isomerase [Fusobacterium perfoetens]
MELKRERIGVAKEVFNKEIIALKKTKEILGNTFFDICEEILKCKGKVIWIGMGKPGHIARKLAATMSSLGTPSFSLHPAEALHGDLGMISKDDIIIIISYSGESEEVVKILPIIKLIGAKIIALTGNPISTLAKNSNLVDIFPNFEEACHLGLAPTSSTTVALVYGDAISVVVSQEKKFNKNDFGKFHPAGALGKKLLYKVEDVMIKREETATVSQDASLKEGIVEMSKKGLSIVCAIANEKVYGILTDGDLRRLLEYNIDIYSKSFEEVMTKTPTVIYNDVLAIEALKILRDKNFTSMPVLDRNENYLGIVTLHSIIRTGIVPEVKE